MAAEARQSKGPAPAHLAARHDGKTMREAAWSAMRRLRRFTIIDLRREVGGDASIERIRRYVQGLESAGYLKRIKPGRGFLMHQFRLERDTGVEAPRVTRDGREDTQGRIRESVWRTIRILKDFTIPELVALIDGLTTTNARSYLRYLRYGGYVVMGPGYRFRILPVMCRGPKAPVVQGNGQVYDPNLGRVVWKRERAS